MSEQAGETLITTASMRELENLLGYRFKDSNLLLQALTHRSYVNEHEGENLQNNESMEFLGDAVLGFLISSRIFQRYPDLTEGELSKIKAYLVSAVNLVRLAEAMCLGDYLRLSRGEEKTGGRAKRAIVADAYEAILGAIYLDGGVEAASAFVDRQIGEYPEDMAVCHRPCRQGHWLPGHPGRLLGAEYADRRAGARCSLPRSCPLAAAPPAR